MISAARARVPARAAAVECWHPAHGSLGVRAPKRACACHGCSSLAGPPAPLFFSAAALDVLLRHGGQPLLLAWSSTLPCPERRATQLAPTGRRHPHQSLAPCSPAVWWALPCVAGAAPGPEDAQRPAVQHRHRGAGRDLQGACGVRCPHPYSLTILER